MMEIFTPEQIRRSIRDILQDEIIANENTFPRVYDRLYTGAFVLKAESPFPNRTMFLYVDETPKLTKLVSNGDNVKALFPKKTSDKPFTRSSNYYHRNNRIINGKICVPLSELIREQRGECLEISTVIQLCMQERGKECYMFSGYLESEDPDEAHTWNVVFNEKKGIFYLYDQNRGFMSPLNGINCVENGVYMIPEIDPKVRYKLYRF